MLNIAFEGIIFKEDNTYVAYSPKLDVSSCGNTIEEARKNLKIAVRLFLEETERMGTLVEILTEVGYEVGDSNFWIAPRIVPTELMNLA